MDVLREISYTHRFWVFLLPLVLMAADVVTGWIQASVNGTWDSDQQQLTYDFKQRIPIKEENDE